MSIWFVETDNEIVMKNGVAYLNRSRNCHGKVCGLLILIMKLSRKGVWTVNIDYEIVTKGCVAIKI